MTASTSASKDEMLMRAFLVVLLLLGVIVGTHGLSIFEAKLRQTNTLIRSRLHAASLSYQKLKKIDLSLRVQDETLLKSIASKLEIPPPLNAPKIVWSLCWKIQSFLMPLLHLFDKYVPSDTCFNLAVLWWKAIGGDKVAFDLLPSLTRNIVRWPLRLLFPRLHHQNVALRTKFLDKALLEEEGYRSKQEKVAVISLGAGFDTRSIRFLNGMVKGDVTGAGMDFFELDLPEVIEQKRGLLERYSQRQPKHVLPSLVEANLNDLRSVANALEISVFQDEGEARTVLGGGYHKIILMVEAVLMYMEREKVAPMLKMVINAAKCHAGSVSFIFSDRFPGIDNQLDKVVSFVNAVDIAKREGELVQDYLLELDNQLNLIEWLPKPGRARHQGVGRVTSRNN